MTKRQRKRFWLASGVILLGLVILLIGWQHQTAVFAFLDQWQNYRQYVLEIRHLGPYAFLVFGLLMIGVTLIPGAPTSAVALIIGACLGHWGGFVVNAIGLTIGNLLQVQLFARVRNHRSKKPDSRVYRALIKMQHPALGVLIGYAVPMIPTAFVNLAAGDTHLTPRARAWRALGFNDCRVYLRLCWRFAYFEARLEEFIDSLGRSDCDWTRRMWDSNETRIN